VSVKVLIVEDHKESREILVHQLRRLGHQVIEAMGGEQGIEKASAEAPDFIFMDLGLPDINGIKAAARIKENPKTADIPIVALTAWSERDFKAEVLKAGMVDYLTKPTSPAVLKATIERFLKAKS
jgi:CheY-like chemotaxis protein